MAPKELVREDDVRWPRAGASARTGSAAPPLREAPRSAAVHPAREPAANAASPRGKKEDGRFEIGRKPACRCNRCNSGVLSPDVMPVSCFRTAVRWLQSLKINLPNIKIITTTILQFTFHEYTRTDPTTPPPNSTAFWLFRRYCPPLPPGRPPLPPGNAVGWWLECGAGAGSVQTFCSPHPTFAPQVFFSFLILGFVLSKRTVEAAAFPPPFQEQC